MKSLLASISIILSLFLLSCSEQQGKTETAASSLRTVDSLPGTCPFLTRDHKGNVVLSWVRQTTDTTGVFCYAVSADGGKSFGQPVLIPSSTNVHPHSENIPKVIFKPSGEIIAVWGASNPSPKNKYSGMIFYSQSFDEGKTWSGAKQLVTDTAGIDQRYFDMALLPNGEAGITWLDNRKSGDKEGSALYFAATGGRNGFQGERRIQEQCCPCCRTDLYVDSKAGIHILYRGILNDSIRDMVHTVSLNGGKTFSTPVRISNDNWVLNACPHTGPAMAENGEGLHFAWYTGGSTKGSFYTTSTDNGKTYGNRDSVSPRGSHPQITSLSNGELVIVWDETIPFESQLRSRIGIQKRSKEGKVRENIYLAEDSLRVTYPVVAETPDRQAVIAFCQKRSGKSYVVFQQMTL